MDVAVKPQTVSAARPPETPNESPSSSRKPAPVWVRWVATVVLSFVILSIGNAAFLQLASMKTAPPREELAEVVLKVEAFRVEAVTLDRSISGFGTAQPDVEVTVSAEVAGTITDHNNLEVGTEVQGPEIVQTDEGSSERRSGDVLVQVDPQTYQERVSQVDTMLQQNATSLRRLTEEQDLNEKLIAQQERRLETITLDYNRTLGLYERGAEAESTVRQKKLELEQYQETLLRLQNAQKLIPIQREELEAQQVAYKSDLKLAEIDLLKSTVRAPISGVVSEVFVELGQYVRTGDPIATITSTDRIEVPIAVSLRDAGILDQMLEAGHPPRAWLARRETQLTTPDSKGVWTGRILRVDPVADEQTRTVQAFVEVENSEQQTPLRPGTFVYARIEGGQITAEQGLLIPRDALLDGQVYLATSSGAQKHAVAEARPVTIAGLHQSFALVSSGVQPGDHIVMTNLDVVTEGSILDLRNVRTMADELSRLRVPYLHLSEEAPSPAAAE